MEVWEVSSSQVSISFTPVYSTGVEDCSGDARNEDPTWFTFFTILAAFSVGKGHIRVGFHTSVNNPTVWGPEAAICAAWGIIAGPGNRGKGR